MLLVQPLDKTLSPKGKAIVAADATRMAGRASWSRTKEPRGSDGARADVRSVDHAIIAIVDGVELPKREQPVILGRVIARSTERSSTRSTTERSCSWSRGPPLPAPRRATTSSPPTLSAPASANRSSCSTRETEPGRFRFEGRPRPLRHCRIIDQIDITV